LTQKYFLIKNKTNIYERVVHFLEVRSFIRKLRPKLTHKICPTGDVHKRGVGHRHQKYSGDGARFSPQGLSQLTLCSVLYYTYLTFYILLIFYLNIIGKYFLAVNLLNRV
jgi:hypothetical protein